MNLNLVVLFVSAVLLGFLYFMQKKRIAFGNRVLTAMLLGVAVGAVFKESALVIQPVGKIFVGLIKMVVIPLVIAALISSITSLENTKQLKGMGFKTIGLLLGTTAAATLIGIVVSNLMNIGAGVEFVKDASFKAREIPTFAKVITDMIPVNPIAAMSNGQVIPVIIFSIFIAVAVVIEGSKKPEKVKPFKDFINSFAQIMFRVTKMVIKLTPYGVFSLMAAIAAQYGIATLIPLAKVILAVWIGCAIHIALTYTGLLAFIARVNPIKFYKKMYPAMVVAFTTQSSYGTLPVTMKALTNRVRISEKIASFAAPMGATIGLNACGGLYPAVVAVFVAKVFNIELSLSSYIMLIASTTLASIGTAGVPGTASIAATVVLSSLGLPIEGLAMVLGVDVIIDMARTMTNVTGAAVTALIVADSEGEFDRQAFNADNEDELELNIA